MSALETQDLIKSVCKKCNNHKKSCFFDYGDSLTKIPCEALRQLALLSIKCPVCDAIVLPMKLPDNIIFYFCCDCKIPIEAWSKP